MTGKELIKWIAENKAEDMDIVTYNDPYIGDLRDAAPEIAEDEGKKVVRI